MNEMTETSRAHSHTGENTRSTCVPVIGLRSSLSRSVTAKAAAVAPSRTRTIRSWGHLATARSSKRIETADEHERLCELEPGARAVELGGGADRALAAWVRVVPPLGRVVGEGRDLALDRRRNLDEPVRDEPVERGGRPLGARGRRVGEEPRDRLTRNGARRHRDGVEQGAMVAVDVGMGRVHVLGGKVANVLLDDRVDLDVGERVEP